MEDDSFVIDVKLACSESGTGSFKRVKGFPSSFDFIIAFSTDKELLLLSIHSIFGNYFDFLYFLSRGINGNWFFGAGFRETWEGFEVWSEVDSKVAAMDPRVNAFA